MKREFLKNFKVGELELPEEVITAILDENSRDIGAAKAKFSDYDDLKNQLVEAGKTIESFKAMDVDGVKRAAEEWKKKAEEAQREAEEKISAMQFESLLENSISAAKGRSSKAVRALLDVDALKASKNQSEDTKKALEALKKEQSYLFETEETPPPFAVGPGTQPPGEQGFGFHFTGIRPHTMEK